MLRCSLENLVKRIKKHYNMKMIDNTENKILEKCIKKDLELILQCLFDNIDNPLLSEIYVK